MELLEKMLEVESEAQQLIEQAQLEANNIRKKAREDAQQLIIDGRKNLHKRVQQEIAQLEQEANIRKAAILQETEQRLEDMKSQADAHMRKAVDKVVQMLINSHQREST